MRRGWYWMPIPWSWRINYHSSPDCHRFCLNVGPIKFSLRRGL